MSAENSNTDHFWLTSVASAALAVGCCVLIGKFAPHWLGIPNPENFKQPDAPKIMVIDANDALVRVSKTPQGANDPTISRHLVDQQMAEMAAMNIIVVDHRAVLAAPPGVRVNTQQFVDKILQSAPIPLVKRELLEEHAKSVLKHEVKSVNDRDEKRPSVQLNMTPEELAELSKAPQSEEDLKRLLGALEEMQKVFEQIEQQSGQKTPRE